MLVAPMLVCKPCLCFCLFVYVCHKPCSRIGFRASSHPSIYMKPRDPLLGALLVDTMGASARSVGSFVLLLWEVNLGLGWIMADSVNGVTT